jgi:hypothetical protein
MYYDVSQWSAMEQGDPEAPEREGQREEWRREREERRREREAWREERRRAREERRRDSRKERVLHTRVSDRLAEDIRSVADELRVPVSNLVRNVLEDVFSVVEVVTDNVGDLVEDVVGEADRAASDLARRVRSYARETRPETGGGAAAEAPRFPEVLGWQPLILNAERDCADCGRRLERGEQALLGLTASGPGSTFLCRDCAP